MLDIDIANEHPAASADQERLCRAVKTILQNAGIASGEVSIAIVDDAQMLELNRRYLNHDYPTDVLSFVLMHEKDRLDGQIILSADYAAREAPRYGWNADDELLLYAIHGALHLVGYDDLNVHAKREMREQEQKYLGQFGLAPQYDDDGD
jgi:probable rRNA maturation factor